MSTSPLLRVLIVDGSSSIRRLVAAALTASGVVQVCGEADEPAKGVEASRRLDPDVVILDPGDGLRGLEFLRAGRNAQGRPRVLVSVPFSEAGGAAALRAAALGASDWVRRPAEPPLPDTDPAWREQLVPRVIALGRRAQRDRVSTPGSDTAYRVPMRHERRIMPVQVVAVVASTGGPAAISEVLRSVPAGFALPIVVGQPMPPVFTRPLAAQLSGECRIPVRPATPGAPLAPGECTLAPGGFHLTVAGAPALVCLRPEADPAVPAPSADALLRSVADLYGPGVLAVVLTGMGADGLRGAEHVVECGGQVLVQDEASSEAWGVPGYVARAGLADEVLPLRELGPEVARRSNRAMAAR